MPHRDPEIRKEYARNYYKAYYQRNKATSKIHSRRWNLTHRLGFRNAVLDRFNNKCVRCGFDDVRALQIDHVNGGGGKHRKTFNNQHEYYRHVLKDTEGAFQVLCANCNWIKRHINQEMNRSGV